MINLSIITPILLVIAHYLGYKLDVKQKYKIEYVRSFSAGFSASYVFLLLLPEVERAGRSTGIQTSILVLMGFIFFHSSLKFIFSNNEIKEKEKLTDLIHIVTTALYSFLITFLAIELIRFREKEGLIIFTIVLLHTVLSEMSHTKSSSVKLENLSLPIIIFSTVLAGMIALVFEFPLVLRTTVFAFTAGAMIYISIREEVPKNSEGKPLFFLLGSFIFLLVFATL